MDLRPDPLAPLAPRRPPSRRAEDPGDGFIFSGVCDLGTPRFENGGLPCQRPSAFVIWLGCTQGEHLGRVELCAADAANPPPVMCSQCKRAGHPGSRVRELRREPV